MAMRVVIDLTATPKNKTGIGRYMLGLLQGLQQVDQENEYILFAHSDDKDGFAVSAPNFQIRTVNSVILRNTWIRILWEQVVFPFRLRKIKADVLHCPNFTAPYGVRLLCRNLKIIGTFHDMSYFFLPKFHVPVKREMFKWYIRRTARFADKLITISENSKKDIAEYCRPRNPDVAVTLLGVEERFFVAEADGGADSTEKSAVVQAKYGIAGEYIMYVGTLEPRKNIPNLIEAYHMLPDAIRERYALAICGKKGWFYEEIYTRLRQWPELEGRVVFTDYVSDEDLPFLLRGASAFAYVSFYEGFGIPVIESFASGTLTVTSYGSSLEEIAEDVAFLSDPNRPDSIKDALETVLTGLSDEEKEERIARGLRRAAEFTWARCARQTLEAYKKA